MPARATVFSVASACAVLTGCAGGAYSNFSPSSTTPSQILLNAAVKETVLHSFAGGAKDGSTPISSLIKLGSLFYGTTGGGGENDKGTVFSISPDGTGFTVLHSFQNKGKGSVVPTGLTNVGGTLYGATEYGGAKDNGTVFSITTAGAFKTLYSFQGGAADGAKPKAALTNVGGTLYGTTYSGGKGIEYTNGGTVFSISTNGQEKVRYIFSSKKDDGLGPASPLVLVKGKLYGTTTSGGNGGLNGDGTIFSVTTGGKETVLYRFKYGSSGACGFYSCYLTDLAGTLYGTASGGGKNHLGSVFSITPAGAFKTLYSASKKNKAGGVPSAPLTNAGGTLYGTMSAGPVGKFGTVFSITTAGVLTTIYTFDGGNDGENPASRLSFVGTKLFGTTAKGGSKNVGTIYSIAGF
jgi:uncharacterized repeat protein (TIGR03803 family)